MLIEQLVRAPDMRHLNAGDAGLAAALRLWVTLNKLGRCPMQAVADRPGSVRAAAHFHLMLEEIGAAWPEPFCVAPLCCSRLSHDEALVLDMVALGRVEDRPRFDRLLGEMLGPDVRDRLFLSASVLGRALD